MRRPKTHKPRRGIENFTRIMALGLCTIVISVWGLLYVAAVVAFTAGNEVAPLLDLITGTEQLVLLVLGAAIATAFPSRRPNDDDPKPPPVVLQDPIIPDEK